MAVNGAKKETGPSCALLGPKAGESPVLALVPRAEGVDHACEVSSTSQTEVQLLSEPPTTMWGPSTSCPRPPRSCWRAGLGADALGPATLCRPGGRWLPRCVALPDALTPRTGPPPPRTDKAHPRRVLSVLGIAGPQNVTREPTLPRRRPGSSAFLEGCLLFV